MCFLQATDRWANLLIQSVSLNLSIPEIMALTLNIERSLLIPAILLLFLWLVGAIVCCSYPLSQLSLALSNLAGSLFKQQSSQDNTQPLPFRLYYYDRNEISLHSWPAEPLPCPNLQLGLGLVYTEACSQAVYLPLTSLTSQMYLLLHCPCHGAARLKFLFWFLFCLFLHSFRITFHPICGFSTLLLFFCLESFLPILSPSWRHTEAAASPHLTLKLPNTVFPEVVWLMHAPTGPVSVPMYCFSPKPC